MDPHARMSHSPTSLNVGTMVNASLCNSLYLLLFCAIPTSLLFFVRKILFLVSVLFMVCKLHMQSATSGHPCRSQYRALFL